MPDDDFRESLTCLRCDAEMEFAGTRQFHEGTRLWDFLGGVFELMKHREALDVYACRLCGKVEFFLAGLGEQRRDRSAALQDVTPELADLPPIPDASDAEAANWTCANCGEKIPANFEICWRCVTPRN